MSKQVSLYTASQQPTFKPSFFHKLGRKLGSAYLSAKSTATEKYLEVTKGINRRIEEEEAQFQEELNHHLQAQEIDLTNEFNQRKKRWLVLSSILVLLSFFAGGITGAIIYFNV